MTIQINKDTSTFYLDAIFVLKAMSKDTTRSSLVDRVTVIDGKLYATDGHRAHWCKADIKDGVYTVSKTKDTIFLTPTDETYPDVVRIIPDYTLSDTIKITSFGSKYDKAVGLSRFIGEIYAAGVLVNSDYVKDAFMHKESKEFTIKIKDELSPVAFENYTCGGVIMPVRK